jgi:ABC-type bacteriocin/lantibiotic exporter with double-glycine peptidase domain
MSTLSVQFLGGSVLTTVIGLVGAALALAGLYLVAPPLALVAVGAALIRYAVVREKETT